MRAGGRFAAAIGNLVYDVLRGKALYGHLMRDEAPRALALAALRWEWHVGSETLTDWASEAHGPGPLSEAEVARLHALPPADLPQWVEGNYPEWLAASFERAFGERAFAQGAGLSRRAPLDLRVNTLKADREKLLKPLSKYGARPGPGPRSPTSAPGAEGRRWRLPPRWRTVARSTPTTPTGIGSSRFSSACSA